MPHANPSPRHLRSFNMMPTVISTAGSSVWNGQFSQLQLVPLNAVGGLQGGRFSFGVQGGTGPLQLPVGMGLQVPVAMQMQVPTSPTALQVPLNGLNVNGFLQSLNGHCHAAPPHSGGHVNVNGSLVNQMQCQSLSVPQQHPAPSQLPLQLQVQALQPQPQAQPQFQPQTQVQVATLGSALAAMSSMSSTPPMSGMTLLPAGNPYLAFLQAQAQAQTQMAGISGNGAGAGNGGGDDCRAGPLALQLQLQLQQLQQQQQQLQAQPNTNAPASAPAGALANANANAHVQTPAGGTQTHSATPGAPAVRLRSKYLLCLYSYSTVEYISGVRVRVRPTVLFVCHS